MVFLDYKGTAIDAAQVRYEASFQQDFSNELQVPLMRVSIAFRRNFRAIEAVMSKILKQNAKSA